jgi:hypothetical protein
MKGMKFKKLKLSRYAMQAPMILILDLGTTCEREVSVTPQPRFTHRERTPVSIEYEAGWAYELVWTQRLEENILCFCLESNPVRTVL